MLHMHMMKYHVLVIESEARQDSICTYKCQSLDPLLALLLVQMS